MLSNRGAGCGAPSQPNAAAGGATAAFDPAGQLSCRKRRRGCSVADALARNTGRGPVRDLGTRAARASCLCTCGWAGPSAPVDAATCSGSALASRGCHVARCCWSSGRPAPRGSPALCPFGSIPYSRTGVKAVPAVGSSSAAEATDSAPRTLLAAKMPRAGLLLARQRIAVVPVTIEEAGAAAASTATRPPPAAAVASASSVAARSTGSSARSGGGGGGSGGNGFQQLSQQAQPRQMDTEVVKRRKLERLERLLRQLSSLPPDVAYATPGRAPGSGTAGGSGFTGRVAVGQGGQRATSPLRQERQQQRQEQQAARAAGRQSLWWRRRMAAAGRAPGSLVPGGVPVLPRHLRLVPPTLSPSLPAALLQTSAPTPNAGNALRGEGDFKEPAAASSAFEPPSDVTAGARQGLHKERPAATSPPAAAVPPAAGAFLSGPGPSSLHFQAVQRALAASAISGRAPARSPKAGAASRPWPGADPSAQPVTPSTAPGNKGQAAPGALPGAAAAATSGLGSTATPGPGASTAVRQTDTSSTSTSSSGGPEASALALGQLPGTGHALPPWQTRGAVAGTKVLNGLAGGAGLAAHAALSTAQAGPKSLRLRPELRAKLGSGLGRVAGLRGPGLQRKQAQVPAEPAQPGRGDAEVSDGASGPGQAAELSAAAPELLAPALSSGTSDPAPAAAAANVSVPKPASSAPSAPLAAVCTASLAAATSLAEATAVVAGPSGDGSISSMAANADDILQPPTRLQEARDALLHGPTVSRLTAQVLLRPPPRRKGPAATASAGAVSGTAATTSGDGAALVELPKAAKLEGSASGSAATVAAALADKMAGPPPPLAPAPPPPRADHIIASRPELTSPPPTPPPPPPPLQLLLSSRQQRPDRPVGADPAPAAPAALPPAQNTFRPMRAPQTGPVPPPRELRPPGFDAGQPAASQPVAGVHAHALLSPRDLTSSLFAAPSWVHVAQLVHRYAAALNGISVAAALKRLAKVCEPRMLDAARPDGAALLSMLQHLCFQAEQHLPSMGPCEVSGVLWALASLGYYPPPHLAAGLAGCLLQEQLDRANGLDLANGLWALGVLGWPVRQRQLRAAWQRMQACYVPGDRSSGRSLLVVLNSATKLGLRLSQAELTHLESQLVGLAPAMSGHDVANALASLTRLAETAAAATSAGSRDGSGYSSSSSSGGGIDAAEVPAPLAADEREDGPDAGAELEEGERNEGAASAAGAELEGPKGSYRPQAGTLRVLLARAASMVSSLRGDEAAMLLYSVARLRFQPPDSLTGALYSRTASQRGATSPSTLALLLWAAGRLRTQPPGWWVAALVEEAARRLPRLPPSVVATALNGVVQLRSYAVEPALAGAFLERAAEVLPDFSAQEVANTAWALGQLPLDCVPAPTPRSALWCALADRARELGFASFTPQGLANLLWGLAVVAAAQPPSSRSAATEQAASGAPAAMSLDGPAAEAARAERAARARRRAVARPPQPLSRETQQRNARSRGAAVAAAAATELLLQGSPGGAAELGAALQAALPRMDEVELSMVLWALAKLRLDPGQAWMEAAVARGAALAPRMPLEGLSAFVHALTWARPAPAPDAALLAVLEEEVARRMAHVENRRARNGLSSRLAFMRARLARRAAHEALVARRRQHARPARALQRETGRERLQLRKQPSGYGGPSPQASEAGTVAMKR